MFRLKTLVPVIGRRYGFAVAQSSKTLPHCLGTVAGRNYALPVAAEPFLNGSSSVYMEAMYEAWQKEPTSVHKVG